MLHMTHTQKPKAIQEWQHTNMRIVNQSQNKKRRKSLRKVKRIRKRRRTIPHLTLILIQAKKVILMSLKVHQEKKFKKRNQRRKKKRKRQV